MAPGAAGPVTDWEPAIPALQWLLGTVPPIGATPRETAPRR
jgi:hypothetical protein